MYPHCRGLIVFALVLASLAAAFPASAGAKQRTVWLCEPKLDDNPCEPGLRTTQLSHSGQVVGVKDVKQAKRRRIDCFYVYPTVSDQPGPQANLDIDPVLRSVALYQAARFSRDCRMFAPVYRQATLSGIAGSAGGKVFETAYSDVRRAWKQYRKRNRGRGVVLIGHSQGTSMLRELVAEEIDPKRSARRKLVSALLIGGGVTVKAGRDRGGDFDRVKACRKRRQIGCVVGYSTFNAPVPERGTVPGGASGQGVWGRTSEPGLEVLCTDPAKLGGRSGKLKTVYPSEPFAAGTIAIAISLVSPPPPAVPTPWLQFKDAYRSRCSNAGDASVLQTAAMPGAVELTPVPDPSWGLHFAGVNIALGNLSDMVRRQARKFVKKRG